MLLHDSRRLTRSSSEQQFISLEHQDRSQWDQKLIKEGVSLALSSLAKGKPGKYRIQAAISSLHATASNWATTDWQQIRHLYDVLLKIQPSPVVALNRSMAIAYSGNSSLALDILNELGDSLSDYQPFFVARAELNKQNNHIDLAIKDFTFALTLTKNNAERDYINSKLISLTKSHAIR